MSYGEISALIAAAGVIPYLMGIFWGSVRPERITWLIWSVILAIGLWSYRASGATEAAWLLAGDLVVCMAVFICSLWRGQGGWNRQDVSCLVIAGAGIVLWQISANSWYGVAGAILADVMAVIPTFRKSITDPRSENPITYVLSSVAAVFGFLAVGSLDALQLTYPVYIFLASSSLAVVIGIGQYRLYTKSHAED